MPPRSNSLTTTWTYDGFGRRLREDRADGTSTSASFTQCTQSCGNARVVTAVRQWKGSNQISVPVVLYSDALGRNLRRQSWSFDGTETLTEREHDANGRVLRTARTRFLSEAPVWTTFGYDSLGRVISVTGPNGTASTAYNGLTTVFTNEKGQTRTDVRNALGKLASTTDHTGKTTAYRYEPFANLAKTTDPKGNEILVTYDRLGRKTQLKDPDLGTWTYNLSAIGELRSQTDAKAQTTTYRYDVLGRTERRLAPDQDAYWVFDTAAKGIGKLTEAYTLIGAGPAKDYRRVHAYDSLGRPAKSTITLNLDFDYVTESTYDGNGRVARTTYQRNAIGGTGGQAIAVDHAYTSTGYLGQQRLGLSGNDTLLWTVEQQDALDRIKRQRSGNGIVTRRDFNASTARLEAIVAGPLAGANINANVLNDTYQYDQLGNLTSRTQLRFNSSGVSDLSLLSETFTYDSLNRLLTSQVAGQAVLSTSYDEIGNITAKSGVGTYAYPVSGASSLRPHAVSSITGTVAGIANPGFGYDNNGNLTSGLGRTASWTSFNLPASINKTVAQGPGAAGTGTVTDVFAYGPEQQRSRQTVTITGGPNAGITTILYGGGMEKETRTKDNVTIVKTYLPQGIVVYDRYTGTTGVNITAAPAARQVRYTHRDRLGSVSAVTDEAGNVVDRMSYDVWGKRRNGDGSENHALQPINPENREGFTEHEHLDAIGLVHMNGRVYDPTLARFMSADPTIPDAGDTQNFNRYSYVLNNPTVYTDPSGFAQVREFHLTAPPGGFSGGFGGMFGGGLSGPGLSLMAMWEVPSLGDLEKEKPKRDPSSICPTNPRGCTVWWNPDVYGSGANSRYPSNSPFARLDAEYSLDTRVASTDGPVQREYRLDRVEILPCNSSARTVPCDYGGGGSSLGDLFLDLTPFVGSARDCMRGSYGWCALGFGTDVVSWVPLAGQWTKGAFITAKLGSTAGSIRNVNKVGGTMNCVNCAIATDATLAGRPASALPGGATRISVLEKTFGASFGPKASLDEISALMSSAGDGARGIVFGSRGNDVGHVFNVVNQGGTVRFLDGQAGGAAVLDGFQSFQLLRTN